MPLARAVALCQGIYFFVTGLWPLVHMTSFVMITGPKVDLWLVQCVGLLIGVMGGVFLWAALTSNITAQTIWLAVGSALSLAGIDTVYALTGRIWPIYLADAVVEMLLVAFWLAAIRRDFRYSPGR